MMFLIVKLGYGSVAIPEKYSNTQCLAIAETINKTYSKEAICIPAPVSSACHMAVPDYTTPNTGGTRVIEVPCSVSTSK